uniref:Uncharacterized protein LOC111099537 isoform X2 n=1 Tax=Crassostrea virginica TaxID=6565 RepID=A0A8B8A9L2_CRAVI|nr:uncharacterized protein LOC111099537 isoform X2 [Crassostrea virginica]
MMAFMNALLKGFMILNLARIFVNADECIVSKSTVKKVKSCPQTAEEWRNAADKKGCESHNHSFLYHCVMNTWRNETVEVCALAIRIVGNVCPEYNVGGCRIQRSLENCSECPVSYSSSRSYLYKGCYRDRVSYSLPSTTYRPSINVETREGNILQGNFSASKSIKESSATKLYTSVPGETLGVSLKTSQNQCIGNIFMTYIYRKEKGTSICIQPSVRETSEETLIPN